MGGVFYYLPRARTECGAGSLGTDSLGQFRTGRDCDCSVLCDDGNACTQATCSNGQCVQATIDPTIVRSPQGGATCTGSSVRFSVLAEGSGNLSYQWSLNGIPAGTNNPVLSLPSVLAADDGTQVAVEVSDGCGTSVSSPVTLTVFANTASCAGGLDGLEAPNGASRVVTRNGPVRWMAPESLRSRGHGGTGGGGAGGTIRVKNSSVHGHSGEFSRTEIDLVIPGRGFDFVWSRTYRSRELVESPQGHQWTHGYDRRVAGDLIVAGNLLLHDGTTARVDSYSPSPALPNCWVKDGFFRTLCLQPDGRYVLTFADKHEWVFLPLDGTPTEGRIEASVDRNGNNMLFQYDPTGRLELIVDTLGRPVQVGYDPSGRIGTVTDFAGRECRYDYYSPGDSGGGSGDLKSVSSPVVLGTPTGNDFPQGRTTTYAYTQGFADVRLNHNLLTITDPVGQLWLQIVYGPTDIPTDGRFDRVDHQIFPDGVLSFSYVQPPPDPQFPQIVSATIVNDDVGNVTAYAYDSLSRIVRRSVFTGRAPDAALPSDAVQNAPVNPVRPTDPPVFEHVVLHNSDFLPVFVQPPNGNQIDLFYDSLNPDPRLRGNLLQRVTHPGPLGGAQQSIVESWGYTTDLGTTYGSTTVGHEMGHALGGSPGFAIRARRYRERYAGSWRSRVSDDDSSDDDSSDDLYDYAGMDSDRNSVAQFDPRRVRGYGGGAGRIALLADRNSQDDDSDSEMYDLRRSRSWGGGGGGRVVVRARFGDDDSFDGMSSDGDSDDLYVYGTGGGGGGGRIVVRARIDDDSMDDMSSDDDSDDLRVRARGSGGGGRVVVGPIAFPTSHTDGRGLTYDFTYDPQGNLRVLETPLVLTGTPGGAPQVILRQWDYNPFGQVTKYTSPAGRVDRYLYYSPGQQEGYLEALIMDDPNLALTTTYEYDPVGNVVRVVDPRGDPTQYVRNELNEVVRIIASPPFFYETDLYYDANGRPYRVDTQNIDEQGIPDPNEYLSGLRLYDPMDRVVRATSEVDDGGKCIVVEFEYDGNDNPVLRRDGEATSGNDPDNVVRRLYDERDLLFQETRAPNSPDASTTQYDYDGNANVVVVRQGLEDPVGSHDTLHEYDGYDRLVRETDALGNTTSCQYDPNDRRVNVRVDGEDKQGAGLPPIRLFEGDYLYDEVNRRVRSDLQHFETLTGSPIGDGLRTTSRAHAPDDRLVFVTDDNGHTTEYIYDSARRPSLITDPEGNSVRLQYDPNSNVTTVTEQDLPDSGGPPEFFVTTHEYDELDRCVRIVDNDGNQFRLEYDSRDNPRVFIDALDNVTRYTYDGLDRRITTVHELTDTGTGVGTLVDTIDLRYCWDDSSRLVCAEDDNGNRTTYEYDSLNRRVRATHPDGEQSLHEFDVHDVELRYTAPNGSVVDRVYDALDRLVATSVTPGPGVGGTTFENFTYDGLHRLRDSSDDDVELELEYDSLSNVVTRRQEIAGQPPGFVVSSHDGVGNVIDRTYPSGRFVFTVYDGLDRPTQVVTNGSLAAGYLYVGPSRVERITRPNGVDTVHEYDSLGRRTRTQHVDSGGISVEDTGLLWDPMDNVVEIDDLLPGGGLTTYEYDSIYRMVRSDSSVSGVTGYDLDGAGNRLFVSGGSDPGQYLLDPALPVPGDFQCNQYTDTPRGPRLYDENGNLLSSGSDLSGVVYDYRDQMVQATGGGGSVYVYSYDPLGNRVEKQDTSTLETIRYYWMDGHVLEEQDLSNLPRATYVYGGRLDGVLQFHEEQDLDGDLVLETYWYLADHLSSVQALTDSLGVAVESYDYGDYGSPEIFDGSGTSLGIRSAKGNPYMFTGLEFQGEVYLYTFGNRGARYMDPRVGRFTSRDPQGVWGDAGNTGNAFSYAGSNPLSHDVNRSRDDE